MHGYVKFCELDNRRYCGGHRKYHSRILFNFKHSHISLYIVAAFLADHTASATLLAPLRRPYACPSVCLSICDAVHCGSQGWCTELKVVYSRQVLFVPSDRFVVSLPENAPKDAAKLTVGKLESWGYSVM